MIPVEFSEGTRQFTRVERLKAVAIATIFGLTVATASALILWALSSSSGRAVDQVHCGEVEREAEEWMNETDKEHARREYAMRVAYWNFKTNISNETKEAYEASTVVLDKWWEQRKLNATYFFDHLNEICNETVKNWFSHFAPSPTCKPKNETAPSRATSILNEMMQISASTTVTRDGKLYVYQDLQQIMIKSRDQDELLWAWGAWHNTTGRQLKNLYAEFTDAQDKAQCQTIPKNDTNAKNDTVVKNEKISKNDTVKKSDIDLAYETLRPFYQQLFTYTRKKLRSVYEGINNTGYIPAHLLGDMMAQEWDKIPDILMPFPNASSNYDVTQSMLDQNYTVNRMFRLAEDFFVSLGLEPMTSDFWEKSLFSKPNDSRVVDCHASAIDMMSETRTDFRIKMCTELNSDNLQIIHHEMGHIAYYMLYRHQPVLFRDGAHEAFHEAVGDTIALSVMTDKHLAAIGLISNTTYDTYEQKINFLMRIALRKVAFLPFMYVIEKWRHKVFREKISPDDYQSAWWDLRKQLTGIAPPVGRTAEDFDPAAKRHIPSDRGFYKYFFSYIAQFQFHAALCNAAGHVGELPSCDIYQSKEAGDKLKSALSSGSSRPWQEGMKLLTGEREFKAEAVLEYFEPLIEFLKVDNLGEYIGWEDDTE